MPAVCARCGQEEYMPFVCKLCTGRFCVEHRLPENHACGGLAEYRTRPRDGRLYRDPHDEAPSAPPRLHLGPRARYERAMSRLEGRVTPVLLGIMVAVGFFQIVVALTGNLRAFEVLFVLHREFWWQPWAVLTSVFSHGSFNHFFANALVLFFFGPTLERLIGSRRFLGLFLATGVAAGLAQALIFGGDGRGVLGASGAIMGVLGTLTVLAPRLTVLVFFVIPAPLWAITGFYALYDLVFLSAAHDSGVAHLAHLAGLGIGLAYGKRLRDQGLRVRVETSPMARYRRYL